MNADLQATQDAIAHECDQLKALLLEKNRNYGNSAINPVRIFSKANAAEQILVRIDDKLSRIGRGAGLAAADEDTVKDLMGYLVLLQVAKRQAGAAVASPDVANPVAALTSLAPTVAAMPTEERRDCIPLSICPQCGGEPKVKEASGGGSQVTCSKCCRATAIEPTARRAIEIWLAHAAKHRSA